MVRLVSQVSSNCRFNVFQTSQQLQIHTQPCIDFCPSVVWDLSKSSFVPMIPLPRVYLNMERKMMLAVRRKRISLFLLWRNPCFPLHRLAKTVMLFACLLAPRLGAHIGMPWSADPSGGELRRFSTRIPMGACWRVQRCGQASLCRWIQLR